MNNFKIVVIVLFLLFSFGCEEIDTRLRVYNNSDRKVFAYILTEIPQKEDDIKQTLQLYTTKEDLSEIICLPKDTLITCIPERWENYFSTNKKVYIGIVDVEQALTQLNKDTIDTTGITYKLYELSYKDLQKRNWVVVYP